MFPGLSAFALSIAAASLIYHSWRAGKSAWLACAGWLAAFGSAWVWSWAVGPEFGVIYAIIVFVCLVWAAIAFTMEARNPTRQMIGRPFQRMRWPELQDSRKHGMLFLLAVPAAGVISMLLSVALVLYLPWSMPVKFAVAIFLYPVLWGALSAWICAQVKVVRPVLVSAGLLTVSSVLLFV